MSIAKQCVTGGRGRRSTAFLQPTTSIPSTWNSVIPSALSEAGISPGGLSRANSLEKGQVLFFTPLFHCGLFLAFWRLLDLFLYLGDPAVSRLNQQKTWMFPCWLSIERAQGKVWADTAEEARRSSPFVSRESQNHRIPSVGKDL